MVWVTRVLKPIVCKIYAQKIPIFKLYTEIELTKGWT